MEKSRCRFSRDSRLPVGQAGNLDVQPDVAHARVLRWFSHHLQICETGIDTELPDRTGCFMKSTVGFFPISPGFRRQGTLLLFSTSAHFTPLEMVTRGQVKCSFL